MENIIQVKIDETRKKKATSIFAKSNLTLPNAIRLFLKRSLSNNSIPSSLLIPADNEMDQTGLKALRQMQLISSLNGNSEMTLDEINAEIAEARKRNKGCNQITQWEYKYVNAQEKDLNDAGEKGWEALSPTNSSVILMKRPKVKQTKTEPEYQYTR